MGWIPYVSVGWFTIPVISVSLRNTQIRKQAAHDALNIGETTTSYLIGAPISSNEIEAELLPPWRAPPGSIHGIAG